MNKYLFFLGVQDQKINYVHLERTSSFFLFRCRVQPLTHRNRGGLVQSVITIWEKQGPNSRHKYFSTITPILRGARKEARHNWLRYFRKRVFNLIFIHLLRLTRYLWYVLPYIHNTDVTYIGFIIRENAGVERISRHSVQDPKFYSHV